MNNRYTTAHGLPSYLTNSWSIRQEIQRFESVHPSIYALYELIEEGLPPDSLLQRQLHDQIVNIEDSFVNSQEWTLSRNIPDIKLGILGTIDSGKTALVNRYLTGTFMPEESPEGARFKKEVIINGQSHLLLVRDEGGMPETQFSQWIDAVIFVFGLDSESSFAAVAGHFARLQQHLGVSGLVGLPMVLVGTQDQISSTTPRAIDDSRARRMAHDLARAAGSASMCTYYETCATYGLNVERVFQDICQRIMALRNTRVLQQPSPHPTPHTPRLYQNIPANGGIRLGVDAIINNQYTGQVMGNSNIMMRENDHAKDRPEQRRSKEMNERTTSRLPFTSDMISRGLSQESPVSRSTGQFNQQPRPAQRSTPVDAKNFDIPRHFSFDAATRELPAIPTQNDDTPVLTRKSNAQNSKSVQKSSSFNEPPQPQISEENSTSSPNLTPNQSRKNYRRSNVFNNKKGLEGRNESNVRISTPQICKQNILHKRSTNPLRSEWKKKFVTLFDDGRLVYHSSAQDFHEGNQGKEIELIKTAVKVPGRRPRGSEVNKIIKDQATTMTAPNGSGDVNSLNSCNSQPDTSFSNLPDVLPKVQTEMKGGGQAKKRHRRLMSGIKSFDSSLEASLLEFVLISLDNQQWHFKAANNENREEWVMAIEHQILNSLQMNISDKFNDRCSLSSNDSMSTATIRSVAGNNACADCNTSSPTWASLNLGILICIECSGIHRNLGAHLSRVRSLDLDDWPSELVNVLKSIGNTAANLIFEANTQNRIKPNKNSNRDDKELWIREKYEHKSFLPPLPYNDVPVTQQLIDAVARQDVFKILLVLAYCNSAEVNTPYSRTDTRTALHIASALGNPVHVQLLLWHGANVKLFDHEGHNALFYARAVNAGDCVRILTANGAQDACPPPQLQ